ncbi:hypothetical protein D3C75_1018290 [compost metagenome]
MLSNDGLTYVVDNAFANRTLGEVAFGVELFGDGIVNTSLNDQFNQREIIDSAHRVGVVCLNIGIEQMPHVRFVWFDIQLFAGVFLYRLTQVSVELHFSLQPPHFSNRVTGFSEVLRQLGKRPHK